MATTITTSTSSSATNMTRATARTSDDVVWVAHYNLASTRFEFWYSSDDGATWTENTSARITVTSPTAASFFIDYNDDAWFAYGTSSDFFWLPMASIDTTTSWGSSLDGNVNSGNGVYACDCVAYADPNYTGKTRAVVVISDDSTSDIELLERYNTSATGGGFTNYETVDSSSGDARSVALDFYHTGDGKTATSTPDIFVAWQQGANGLAFRKLNYGAFGSTLGTARTIGDAAANTDPMSAVFDGSRFVMVTIDDGSDTTVSWYERDAGDTTTTSRTPTALSDGAITALSIAHNTDGDARVYAVGTTSDDVKRCEYDRSGNSFGSWQTIEATTATAGSLTAQRAVGSGGQDVVWTSGSGSPYNVEFERDFFNRAPLGPVWVSPSDNSTQDVGSTLALTWAFTDLDPGDSQTAYALSRTISGTTTYYNAGSQTWGGTETKNTSGTEGVTVPTAWASDGNTVTFAVKTWDVEDVEGVYGDDLTILASTPVTPVLTAPTDSGTIAVANVTVTWTATEQTAYRLRLLTSGDVELYDTGKVTSTDKTVVVDDYYLSDATTYKVEVRVWNDEDLEGPTDTHTFDVDYDPPETPVLTVTAVPASGYIQIDIADPTPTGAAPTVEYHDVYVRVASGGRRDVDRTVNDDGIRISTGDVGEDGTYLDYAAGMGIDYEYRTQAWGSGVFTYSAWT